MFEVYSALMAQRKTGKVCSVGVSNFRVRHLAALKSTNLATDLVEYCKC